MDYADAFLVEDTVWDPYELSLGGEVEGSRGRIYTTIVDFAELTPELIEISYTECDCPMNSDCKHVVALLLTINRAKQQPLPKDNIITMRPPGGKRSSDTPSPLQEWEAKVRSALEPARNLWTPDLYS